jgi:hypothetical protein
MPDLNQQNQTIGNLPPNSPAAAIGNNANPDFTQNQPAGMPFGQGAGVNDEQDIPNLTRKVQYTAEGNDPFSQLISSGDRLIHNAGMDYGSGTLNPDHYDVVNAFYNIGAVPKSLYDTRKYERDIVRPRTTNEALNTGFRNNLGESVFNVSRENHDAAVNAMNGIPQDEHQNIVNYMGQNPTHQLISDYGNLLRDVRSAPNGISATNGHNLAMLRVMHNELARRGINTEIFNQNKYDSPKAYEAAVDHELREYNRRLGIFRENHGDFHNRIDRMDNLSALPPPPPPPPAAPPAPPDPAGRRVPSAERAASIRAAAAARAPRVVAPPPPPPPPPPPAHGAAHAPAPDPLAAARDPLHMPLIPPDFHLRRGLRRTDPWYTQLPSFLGRAGRWFYNRHHPHEQLTDSGSGDSLDANLLDIGSVPPSRRGSSSSSGSGSGSSSGSSF